MKDSKHKVEFTLKQHTPIIHFQSDQSGATLRATELKPKFDRFLKKYAFGNDFERYKIFLIGYDDKKKQTKKDFDGKEAFNYKILIETIKSDAKEITNKTYFGNMGKKPHEEEYRYAIKIDQSFKIHFLTFNTIIKENIEKLFCSFLAVTNFGSRQNKGFGSYYLDKNDPNYKAPIDALEQIKANFIYATYINKDEKIFEHVEVIYPLIKTGINYPDYKKIDHPRGEKDRNGKIKQVPDPTQGRGLKASYYKSYLFTYMLNQNPSIGNEKKFIKENFFINKIKPDNMTKKYVRALLGIGDGIEFKDHERKGKIEYSNPQVERFKSPLTFKIVDNYLIIVINDIEKEIFDKSFTFKDKFDNKKSISTPKENEFNLVDFMYAFADYFNNELKIDKEKNRMNMFDEKIASAKIAKFLKASK